MSMSKQDYVAIAHAFRQEYDLRTGHEDFDVDGLEALSNVLPDLCKVFAANNERFDRRMFLFAATGSHDLHLSLIEQEG